MALADAKPFATVAYPLDEPSGNAIDAVGALDMTEVNTVGTGTVFGGAARDFEESEDDRFTHADNDAFDSGDIDWTFTAMVQMESKTQAYPCIFGKVSSDGGTIEYHVIYRGSQDRFEFRFGSGMVRSTDAGSPSTATDYLIHCVHRASADELAIYVNGVKTQVSYSSGNTATTRGVAIGSMGQYHDGDSGWDGLIREVVICKNYAFSDADVAEHNNSGDPIPFADWDAGGGATNRRRRMLIAGRAV